MDTHKIKEEAGSSQEIKDGSGSTKRKKENMNTHIKKKIKISLEDKKEESNTSGKKGKSTIKGKEEENSFKIPFSDSSEKPKREEEYFPLNTNIFWKSDHRLWKTISEYTKPFMNKKGIEYYGPVVESLNKISSKDLRFAALIEFGNISGVHGCQEAYEKAFCYLKEIISEVDPNTALIALKKYFQSYCFQEGDEYIPDYVECWNYRASVSILLRLSCSIKGGDKSLRNELAVMCRIFMKELDQLNNPQHNDSDFDSD
ncbi:hypothetical protein PIROE2DRAFT_7795 [Piromyces sp. E2]|nr:hypothetical protein PIROE2DRAFT_7795 [Piromyces sp. E2]|eukprot:OUM65251.1 hypothetical protein PIROE2DRAFT_7795 [Piromyces sp. E2]